MFVLQNAKLMKKFSPIILALATLVACEKSVDNNPNGTITQVNSSDEIVVPDGFDFKMTKMVQIPVKVKGSVDHGKSIVEVYQLSKGGKKVYGKYAITPRSEAVLEVQVPSYLESVLLDGMSAQGEKMLGQYRFGSEEIVELKPLKSTVDYNAASHFNKMTTSGPGCSSCPTTVTSISGSKLTVSSGSVVCLTGGLSGKKVDIEANAELRICGTYTNVQDIDIADGGKLVLNDNASVTMKSGKAIDLGDESKIYVYDGATLNLEKELYLDEDAELWNYGTIYSDKHIEIEDGGYLENHSTITLKGHLEVMESGSEAYNYGFIETTNNDHIKVYDSGVMYNHCRIFSDQHIWIEDDGIVHNYGLIEADHKLKMNDDGILNMYDASMALVEDLQLYDAEIIGNGTSRSLVKATDDAHYYNGAKISGIVDICIFDLNQNSSNITWSGTAAFSCATSISTTACITTGNTPPVVDSDNDGIPDDQDDYPNDPERAADVSRAPATLIAEDMWPYKGDYDFNDLVLLYRWNYVIDGQSDIKEITFRYQVKARGAAHDNGFAFSFDTDESNVESVTGGVYVNNFISLNSNGTEASSSSSTSSCFVITDKLENNLPLWNTYPNEPMSTPVWIDFRIVFTNAINPAVLNTFNPFMISQKRRQVEIHLAHYMPTNLVDTDFFGRADDASDIANGISYVTSDGMPWVLEVPEDFQYVIENIDLSHAYVNFPLWVQSSGSSAADWYDWQLSNNINGSNLISGGN